MNKCLSTLLFYAVCLYGVNSAANDNLARYNSKDLAKAWRQHQQQCQSNCFQDDYSTTTAPEKKQKKIANATPSLKDDKYFYWW